MSHIIDTTTTDKGDITSVTGSDGFQAHFCHPTTPRVPGIVGPTGTYLHSFTYSVPNWQRASFEHEHKPFLQIMIQICMIPVIIINRSSELPICIA